MTIERYSVAWAVYPQIQGTLTAQGPQRPDQVPEEIRKLLEADPYIQSIHVVSSDRNKDTPEDKDYGMTSYMPVR